MVTAAIVAACLLSGALPAGAGQGSAGSMPAPAPAETALGDACALLTSAQVGAALGVKVGAGEHPVAAHTFMCGWADPKVPRSSAKKALLTLITERQFDFGKMEVPGVAKSVVSGVGDDAYSVVAGSVGTALNVRRGDRYFQVKAGGSGLTAGQAQAIEKRLALAVLAR